MTLNYNAPYFVLAAVKRIYGELPSLTGAEAWSSIQPQVDAHIKTLEAEPDAFLASTQLFGLLAQYEPARQRMADEINIQADLSQSLEKQLRQIAEELGFDTRITAGLTAAALANLAWEADPETIPSAEELQRSRLKLEQGGVGGATSVSFKNMRLSKWDFATVAAGFVTTGFDMANTPHPIFIAGCIVLVARMLRDKMTLHLSEQDASVFWGMIRAGEQGELDKTAIMATTNAEREKYRLDPLSENQLERSLETLEKIKSIEKVGDVYRIIERFKIEE